MPAFTLAMTRLRSSSAVAPMITTIAEWVGRIDRLTEGDGPDDLGPDR